MVENVAGNEICTGVDDEEENTQFVVDEEKPRTCHKLQKKGRNKPNAKLKQSNFPISLSLFSFFSH